MSLQLKKIDVTDLRPIREIVLERLRKAIFDGSFELGERLVESYIAEVMGVSRTPVREALRQLEIEGLAVNVPRKGTIVKGISREDALEIYEIREVLEGLAIRSVCANISKLQIMLLKENNMRMKQAIELKDIDEYNKLHEEFNNIILHINNNKRLINEMKHIYEYLISLRSITLSDDEARKKAFEEHKAIIEAIEKQDEELAEKLARKHVREAKKRFIESKKN
ncbi:GntR family transcriptional regulator [Clostridium sp. AWRP]|uniref:GntR family transcriptional regulator n=1 Tax=Clostridium sp. AWRP TaxID=2212991 RepID=UPI000FD93876|nr:GntR family transcriptional regulator [Clostridium sp. AWRP]AZV57477.1 GntR family transcriptional regulator [Clostridium sp. AWRP]